MHNLMWRVLRSNILLFFNQHEIQKNLQAGFGLLNIAKIITDFSY